MTAAGVAIYHLCHRISVPVLAPGAREMLATLQEDSYPGPGISILAVGLTPFLIGFLVVELLSMIPAWGRKYRWGGFEGRRTLNTFAFRCSLVVTLIYASGLASTAAGIRFPGGSPLMQPGLGPFLMATLTWTAAATAVFGLCQIINRRGLGNGFCVIIAADLLYEIWKLWSLTAHRLHPQWSEYLAGFALLAAATAAACLHFLKRRVAAEVAYRDEPGGHLDLPSFPQSLVPLLWAPSMLLAPTTLGLLFGADEGLGALSLAAYLPAVGILVLLFSFLTVRLFSTRKRIEDPIPGLSLAADFETVHGGSVAKTTALLTVFAVAWAVFNDVAFGFGLTAVPIVVFTAIALDLVEEWRFRRTYPGAVRWMELDNVHLASYVAGLLRRESIPCVVQAFHFRSLFFFMSPLEKMAILVPEERLPEAERRVEHLETPVV
ncbi:MAG: hypothetical protein AAFX50_06300 [Acidobacteriota bacterium]